MEDKITAETRARFEALATRGVVTDHVLNSFLNSLEKKDGRQKKKLRKINKIQTAHCEPQIKTALSYDESVQIWGERIKRAQIPDTIPNGDGAILLRDDFNFMEVCLQGISLEQAAYRFRNHDWRAYARNKQTTPPGVFIVSLSNPLVNLPPRDEEEAWPEALVRLELSQLVELLLSLDYLKKPVPQLYFRTTFTAAKESCA